MAIINYKQRENVENLLKTLKRTNDYLNYLSNKKSFKQSEKDWRHMEGIVTYLDHYIYELEEELKKPLYYDLNHEAKLEYQREYRRTHKEQNRAYMKEYMKRRKERIA